MKVYSLEGISKAEVQKWLWKPITAHQTLWKFQLENVRFALYIICVNKFPNVYFVVDLFELGRYHSWNWSTPKAQPLGGQDPQLFHWPSNFGQLLTWEMHFCFLWKVDFFKISLSTTLQIERIEVRNSQNFPGRSSPSPLPRPLSHSFSGFALDLGFALKSWALCVLDSGVAQFAPKFWSVVAPLVNSSYAIWRSMLNFVEEFHVDDKCMI